MSPQPHIINPHLQETMSASAKYLALVALLLFTVFSFYLFTKYDQSREDKNLVAEYRDPDYSLLQVESSSLDDTWTQATMTFMMKDYQKSLSLMDELEGDKDFMAVHNGKYRLMKGVAYLRTGQHQKAEGLLNNLQSAGAYHNQALWYSVINYMQQKKYGQAKDKLEEIIQAEYHPKRKEAIIILKGMDE